MKQVDADQAVTKLMTNFFSNA